MQNVAAAKDKTSDDDGNVVSLKDEEYKVEEILDKKVIRGKHNIRLNGK